VLLADQRALPGHGRGGWPWPTGVGVGPRTRTWWGDRAGRPEGCFPERTGISRPSRAGATDASVGDWAGPLKRSGAPEQQALRQALQTLLCRGTMAAMNSSPGRRTKGVHSWHMCIAGGHRGGRAPAPSRPELAREPFRSRPAGRRPGVQGDRGTGRFRQASRHEGEGPWASTSSPTESWRRHTVIDQRHRAGGRNWDADPGCRDTRPRPWSVPESPRGAGVSLPRALSITRHKKQKVGRRACG